MDSMNNWKLPMGATVEVLYGGLSLPTMVALVHLEPRARWPEEVHADHDEHVEVIAGSAAVTFAEMGSGNSETAILLSADAPASASIGAGRRHAIVAGDSGATYLSIMRRK